MESNFKKELIKKLRFITAAGMLDCVKALEESNLDIDKAVDIIKTKGQNIVSEREGKLTLEGLVVATHVGGDKTLAMVEVNCQTDFVSRSSDFKQFAEGILTHLSDDTSSNVPFDINNQSIVDLRTNIIGKTKENCVIRRWWVEQVFDDSCKTFSYIHNGEKLGVIISLKAPSIDSALSKSFAKIGNDLAMQVAAMNPLAVSVDKIPADLFNRQKAIFESQLLGLNKPQTQWNKIIDGKLNKWYTEICLLKQESVVVPKKSIEQLIKTEYATLLDGELEIINFIRCEVGSV